MIGATSSGIGQLLIATALRGAAAAISVPCALRLLLHVADSSGSRRSAVAAWSACGALAGVLGYVVGGVLTQTASWRAIYAVNAPIGLLLLAGVLVAVPALAAQRQVRLDVPGAVLLVSAVMTVIVGSARTRGAAAGRSGDHRRWTDPEPGLRVPAAPGAIAAGASSRRCLTRSADGVGDRVRSHGDDQLGWSAGHVAAAGNLVLAITAGALAGAVAGVVVAGIGLGLASVASTAIGTDVAEELVGSATGLLNTAAPPSG